MQVSRQSGDGADRVVGLDSCAVPCEELSGRLGTLAGRLPGRDEAINLADLFRLLGDPTRCRVLYALLEAGELCVCDLAEVVGAAETVVSQGLRLLRTAGVVRNRRQGRQVFYGLEDAHVRLLLDLSREHLRHGPLR
jgi:DNA-binding transcriptional ArsR family regulator